MCGCMSGGMNFLFRTWIPKKDIFSFVLLRLQQLFWYLWETLEVTLSHVFAELSLNALLDFDR